MAISNDLKLIFIHIPKNAGTSIINSLQLENHGHYKWKHYKWKHYKLYNDYYKISVVRNPWDRVVSNYFYIKTINTYWHSYENIHPDYNLIKNLSFEDTLKIANKNLNIFKGYGWYLQYDYIVNNDKLMIDTLYNFENLQKLINDINDKYNTNFVLLNQNSTNRKDYHEYYNSITKDIVYKLYKKDIKYFKYEY